MAEVLENLMGLAARSGTGRVRTGPREPALRKARICYDHLAGELGVRLFDSLLSRGVIAQDGDDLNLGPAAEGLIATMELDIPAGHRPVCRACLDWSARRHHLAGKLGAALLVRFFALGWAHRDKESRVVTFSADGERQFLLLTRTETIAISAALKPVTA